MRLSIFPVFLCLSVYYMYTHNKDRFLRLWVLNESNGMYVPIVKTHSFIYTYIFTIFLGYVIEPFVGILRRAVAAHYLRNRFRWVHFVSNAVLVRIFVILVTKENNNVLPNSSVCENEHNDGNIKSMIYWFSHKFLYLSDLST